MFELKCSQISEKELRTKITVLSFISALLVVLIHSYYVFDYSPATYDNEMMIPTKIAYFFNRLGYRYAVQFFFLMSGFLLFRNLNEKTIGRKLKSRVFSLIVPYILWNIFYIVFWLIASKLGWSDTVVELNPLSLVCAIVTHKYFSTFWFVGNLIIYVAVSPLIFFLEKWKRGSVLILDMVLVMVQFLISIKAIDFDLGYYCPIGTDWFLYFLCGINIAIYKDDLFTMNLEIKHKKIVSIVGLVILSALIKGVEDIWIVEFILTICTILFVVVIVSSCADYSNFLERSWMKKSFAIYAWHGMVCSFVSKVVYRMLPDTYEVEVIAYLSYIFIGLMVVMVLDEIAKKVIPQIRKAFLGGRDSG